MEGKNHQYQEWKRNHHFCFIDTTKTIKEYHEQIYANEFNNQHEMENSPEKLSWLKLRQEETENLKIPTFIYYGTWTYNLRLTKLQAQMASFFDLYHTLKEEIIPRLHRLFQKIGTNISQPFCEAQCTTDSKAWTGY